MIKPLSDSAIRFIASGPGLALILVVSLGGVVAHLGSLRSESDRLQEEVSRKQEEYSRNIESAIGSSEMKFVKSELDQWGDLAGLEARRSEALTVTALAADVTILSLRSLDPVLLEEEQLSQVSHEIESVGEQQEISRFLDDIYAMDGMASIQSLVISSDEEEGNPEMLLATMKVTWFAPAPETEVAQ